MSASFIVVVLAKQIMVNYYHIMVVDVKQGVENNSCIVSCRNKQIDSTSDQLA